MIIYDRASDAVASVNKTQTTMHQPEQFDSAIGECRLDGSLTAAHRYNPLGGSNSVDNVNICKEYCLKDNECDSFHFTSNSDSSGECWIWTVADYVGNGSSGSTCYVKKTYDQYQSLKITDRNDLPKLTAFGILKDYPVTKGHQDTIHFYLASKDSYDTSVKVTLKYTVCG